MTSTSQHEPKPLLFAIRYNDYAKATQEDARFAPEDRLTPDTAHEQSWMVFSEGAKAILGYGVQMSAKPQGVELVHDQVLASAAESHMALLVKAVGDQNLPSNIRNQFYCAQPKHLIVGWGESTGNPKREWASEVSAASPEILHGYFPGAVHCVETLKELNAAYDQLEAQRRQERRSHTPPSEGPEGDIQARGAEQAGHTTAPIKIRRT